jgi:phosphoribosylglycinamide formyltransferase 1
MDDTRGRVRVAVLISGAGSNMAALIDAGQRPDAPYEVVLVVSNDPDAGGVAIARAKNVGTVAIDHRPFGTDRAAHEAVIHAALDAERIEVVALAGYMRLLTPWLVGRWEGRMLNIHPSLLPNYPGLNTHARAIAAGDAVAGCTVHLVSEGVDEGPVLARAEVPIVPGDTPQSLAQRVLTTEHRLYPEALADFCTARLGRICTARLGRKR